jgi:hypothetical protein
MGVSAGANPRTFTTMVEVIQNTSFGSGVAASFVCTNAAATNTSFGPYK